MAFMIKCRKWCSWYGYCQNTGASECTGLVIPDEEEGEDDYNERKIESMTH